MLFCYTKTWHGSIKESYKAYYTNCADSYLIIEFQFCITTDNQLSNLTGTHSRCLFYSILNVNTTVVDFDKKNFTNNGN